MNTLGGANTVVDDSNWLLYKSYAYTGLWLILATYAVTNIPVLCNSACSRDDDDDDCYDGDGGY